MRESSQTGQIQVESAAKIGEVENPVCRPVKRNIAGQAANCESKMTYQLLLLFTKGVTHTKHQ